MRNPYANQRKIFPAKVHEFFGVSGFPVGTCAIVGMRILLHVAGPAPPRSVVLDYAQLEGGDISR
jgi:hypothetical protein